MSQCLLEMKQRLAFKAFRMHAMTLFVPDIKKENKLYAFDKKTLQNASSKSNLPIGRLANIPSITSEGDIGFLPIVKEQRFHVSGSLQAGVQYLTILIFMLFPYIGKGKIYLNNLLDL